MTAIGLLAAPLAHGSRPDASPIGATGAVVIADSVQEAAAQRAAEAWLRLIDGRQYDASWDSSAAVFRQAIAKADWGKAVAQARGSFEPLVTRTLKGRRAMSSPPNAPPGDYVVIQYATAGGGQPLVETITMFHEGTAWRTVGYYIKPA
jgi:hypothetical protein